MRIARLAPVLLAVSLAVPVAAAGPAWAHAAFRTAQVDPGQSLDAVLKVAVEVPDAESIRVIVDIPVGFVLSGCDGPFGWTCQRTDRQVRYDRVTGVAGDGDFTLSLTAPREPGPYSFRTEQTLDNGDTETYDGDPFSENPAPVIVVRGKTRGEKADASPKPAQQPPPQQQPAPPQAQRTDPAKPAAPRSAPSAQAAEDAAASTAPLKTGTAQAAAPSAPGQAAEPDNSEGDADGGRAVGSGDGGGEGGGDGPPLLVLLLAGAVLAAAGSGVAAAVRHRTRDLGSGA